MKNNMRNSLAGIEYAGVAGASAECKKAVMRLIQYGDHITHARILSYKNTHCFLLTVNGDLVAIKSGFRSGYLGEGPHAFSYILQLLYAHNVDITEHKVNYYFIQRLDMSSLRVNDIDKLDTSQPIRPNRWGEYLLEYNLKKGVVSKRWQDFPTVIPFAIVDDRISDLAMDFWGNPGENLTTGYRRLEDIVRQRINSNVFGKNLFSDAFLVLC